MAAPVLEEIVRHKWHANAAYLAAVYRHEPARQDEELRKLFLHILVSNRFWLFLTLEREFDREREVRLPETLEPLIESYKATEALEMEWLSHSDEAELSRQLVTPRFPGKVFTVAQAAMQAVLHSHGHRAQSAARLRTLGVTPPSTDFILWAMEQPTPEWPARTAS